MDRAALTTWVQGYVAAWRAPGTAALDALFSPDATYRPEPFAEPHRGLTALQEM